MFKTRNTELFLIRSQIKFHQYRFFSRHRNKYSDPYQKSHETNSWQNSNANLCSNSDISTDISTNIVLGGFGTIWLIFCEPALPLYIISIVTKQKYPKISYVTKFLCNLWLIFYTFLFISYFVVLFAAMRDKRKKII
jgi:hypothetical protein